MRCLLYGAHRRREVQATAAPHALPACTEITRYARFRPRPLQRARVAPRSVFSAERPGGARTFLAATPAEFWRRACDVPPQHRHFYEIIRQGWPCHLYFGALRGRAAAARRCRAPQARCWVASLPLSHGVHADGCGGWR